MMSRLALGTVQFGLDYGIANRGGQVNHDTAAAILDEAGRQGIDTLDTAIGYGQSESVLGGIGMQGYRIVTKLPAVPDDCVDIDVWVQAQMRASLARLRVDSVHGVLLHRPEQLLSPAGPALYAALERLKSQGLTVKTGVSIYAPQELDGLASRFALDLVQSPLSILDRRLVNSGWSARLAAAGTELHVRSVFLQGLLLMPESDRPAQFTKWQPIWNEWSRWLDATGHTPMQACLRYAMSVAGVARVVVGVDSVAQLLQIAGAVDGDLPSLPTWPDDVDITLLNPALWTSR